MVPRRVCARVCGCRVLCAHCVDFGGVTDTRVLYRCYSVLCGVPSYARLQCRRTHASNNFTDALPRSISFFPSDLWCRCAARYRHTRALRTTCPRCGDTYTSDVSSSCGGVTERARYVAVCGTPCSLTVLKRLVWNASRRHSVRFSSALGTICHNCTHDIFLQCAISATATTSLIECV